MAFEIGTITEEDLPFVFPNKHDFKWENITLNRATRDYFYGIYQDANKRKEIAGKRWVVDKERRAFMTVLAGSYTHNVGPCTYLFGWEGGTAVFKRRDYCIYEFFRITNDLLPRIEQLKPLIAEALALGGESLEGVGGQFYEAVPHAEFLPYPSKGA